MAMRNKLVVALLVAVGILAVASAGQCAPRGEGDRYPTKPINYLVVWDPGGQSDRTARLQQPLLEKMLGQKIVIDYKVGGGGAVGWAQFVRSRPDGYSIAGTNLPTIVTQPMMQDVGYTDRPVSPDLRLPVHTARPGRQEGQPLQDPQGLPDRRQGRSRQAQHRRRGPLVHHPHRGAEPDEGRRNPGADSSPTRGRPR